MTLIALYISSVDTFTGASCS